MEAKEKTTIPFVKAVRVGNYKVWRGKYVLGQVKIDCLHISNLDGSWMMRIPATMSLYGVICDGYATEDEKLREQFLGMIFKNIYTIGTSASEALHDAFSILSEMFIFPYLFLSEKEMVKRMKDGVKKYGFDKKDIEGQIKEMVQYRKDLYELIEKKRDEVIDDFERHLEIAHAAEPEAEKEMEQDAIAEQAMEILNEDKTQ